MFSSGAALATTVSTNTGSRGAAANGVNADAVSLTTGVVTAGSDSAAVYNNTVSVNTTVPYQAELNTSPFSIEFWAKPSTTDGDDAPVANRVSTSPRLRLGLLPTRRGRRLELPHVQR